MNAVPGNPPLSPGESAHTPSSASAANSGNASVRQVAGYICVSIAVLLVGFLFVFTLITITGIMPRDESLAEQGRSTGSVFGVIFRTLLVLTIAGFLYSRGMSLIDPEHYSPEVLLDQELTEICLAERDLDTSRAEPHPLYRSASTDDLIDVYRHIDRQGNPFRFAQLIAELRRRLSEQPTSATDKLVNAGSGPADSRA